MITPFRHCPSGVPGDSGSTGPAHLLAGRGPEWSARWPQLARASRIAPGARLLLALSGGADSVLLLHLLAAAEERPDVHAVHVDHGLRGAESDADARFCEQLCAGLGVPFTLRRLALPEGPGSLEARARRARYRALCEEAQRLDARTILTGHHSDDVLETLLQRWIRGSELAGLRGARARLPVGTELGAAGGEGIMVVRPLLHLRREEVRRLLTDRGLLWREDGSNRDGRFTRNRLRHRFLPLLAEVAGEEGVENLRAFGRAVEALEDRLAGATAHLSWSPAPYARASRGPRGRRLGGVLPRAALMRLHTALRRRALWRLLVEGIGRAPRRAALAKVLGDLESGRCTRHALRGGWSLLLRSDTLHLVPPGGGEGVEPAAADPAPGTRADGPDGTRQGLLPFPLRGGGYLSARDLAPGTPLELSVPGIVTLPDGRRVSAERVRVPADAPVPADGWAVELEAAELPERLAVRWPVRGDRFHALGAPGSKPLRRFLADRGVPREERGAVPLVVAGDEVLWVVGFEPGHRHRLRARSRERLRLALHGA